MPLSHPLNNDDDSVDLESHEFASEGAHANVRSVDLDACPFCEKTVCADVDVCPYCRNFIGFEAEKRVWPSWMATLALMIIVAALGVAVIVLLQRGLA